MNIESQQGPTAGRKAEHDCNRGREQGTSQLGAEHAFPLNYLLEVYLYIWTCTAYVVLWDL